MMEPISKDDHMKLMVYSGDIQAHIRAGQMDHLNLFEDFADKFPRWRTYEMISDGQKSVLQSVWQRFLDLENKKRFDAELFGDAKASLESPDGSLATVPTEQLLEELSCRGVVSNQPCNKLEIRDCENPECMLDCVKEARI